MQQPQPSKPTQFRTAGVELAELHLICATRNGCPEEFADMCGLDRTYIGGIERGERNVALQNIERIAKAFGASLSEMFRNV